MLSLTGALDVPIRIAIWGGLLLLLVLLIYQLAISLRQAKVEQNLLGWWLESSRASARQEVRATTPEQAGTRLSPIERERHIAPGDDYGVKTQSDKSATPDPASRRRH